MTEFDVVEHMRALVREAKLKPIEEETLQKFASYLELFERWNQRINLSSIRDTEGILQRHFVESIACAQYLPVGIDQLLDFGSGGGLPGIPIALCRQEIHVTLAESQGKKAAFLQEAVRKLQISAKVYAGRAEQMQERFDCVVLRAVDKMEQAVASASKLVAQGGYLGLMTTVGEVEKYKEKVGEDYVWQPDIEIPGGNQRILFLGKRLS